MTKTNFSAESLPEQQEYLEVLLDFLCEAGKVANRLVWSNEVHEKKDCSPVTQADIEISLLAKKMLAPYLSLPSNFLLDEESPESHCASPEEVLKNRFLWILDPIDGTRLFINHMPTFSVSLGILKDGKPWIGGVYFPVLRELFYSDGSQSFFVQNAFSNAEESREIVPVDSSFSRQKYFFFTEKFLRKFRTDFSPCKILNSGSATVDLCFPSVGRGCGSIFHAYLWDLAGAWQIFLAAGFNLWNLTTGEPLLSLKKEDFLFDGAVPWKLKEIHILASEENFQLIRKGIREK